MSTATVNLVELAAIWRDSRRIYPIYLALNQQCEFGLDACRELESPIDRSDPQSIQRVQGWFDRMDSLVEVHQLRQLLQTSHIAGEEGLRALLKRQLALPEKNNRVRDKVDYLLVQYYAHCVPHDAHNTHIDHDHVSEILNPVLGDVSPLVPDFCEDLDNILQELDECSCLGDLLEKKIIDRARVMKEQAGQDYFKPSVLVAYTRFNFLLRRGFFRLMHADLHAIRLAIHAMEGRGQHHCDCRPAGLAEQQPFAELREICHDWKKPFRAAYSLGNTFAQLVAIRIAVETAMALPSQPESPAEDQAPVAETAAPVKHESDQAPDSAVSETAAASHPPQVSLAQSVPPSKVVVDTVQAEISAVDECADQVYQVLSKITISPSAVCNFTLSGTKLGLASWEAMAFVKPTTKSAPALRRAVAARVLLIKAIEARKSGEMIEPVVVSQAHIEAANLQVEITGAKERREIDAAVNLAATAKRLIALVEQAEKRK